MTDEEKLRLDTDGYLVLENLMDLELLRSIRQRVEELFEHEGAQAGAEFKLEPHARRLANLIDKGEVFERVIETPRILDCMEHVLGPRFKLSSLNVRSADPHNGTSQPLHADSGAVADDRGFWVCNSVWMLDAFTEQNGRDPHGARVAPLGSGAAAGVGRSLRSPSARDSAHRSRRNGGRDERAHVAWRHGQSHNGRAARHARLLHALGQAAAAVPEAAAASGNAEPVESFGAEDSGARRSAQRRAELAALRDERIPKVSC